MKPKINKYDSSIPLSRFTLVVVSAKRARQILSGSKIKLETKRHKPVTIALEEFKAGKVQWIHTKEGIK
ncbi:MAG: DNA-directed RNA polymerase subunit omega [Firmicutes bacterium]|nr:DNA-directed RNA polymerase subunit omega [Bacillota bacterium]